MKKSVHKLFSQQITSAIQKYVPKALATSIIISFNNTFITGNQKLKQTISLKLIILQL